MRIHIGNDFKLPNITYLSFHLSSCHRPKTVELEHGFPRGRYFDNSGLQQIPGLEVHNAGT